MDRQPKILDALLDDTGKELFLTNAAFRHQMESLSAMLPAMVDGLAAEAAARQGQADRRIADLLRGQPDPVLLSREQIEHSAIDWVDRFREQMRESRR